MNAILYAGNSGVGHDGDLIEKDLSGKGGYRKGQFSDHDDIMRETAGINGNDDDVQEDS